MNQVRVGVSVILRTPWGNPMLLRKGSHGAGTWCFPGGHLEHGESVLTCAIRELKEELGVTPDQVNILPWFTEDHWGDLHYITLYVGASTTQEPRNMETDRCEQIQYVHADAYTLRDQLAGATFGGCDQAWQNYLKWCTENSG
jgi:8-oxo-dGTP diphosphatase